MYGDQSVSSNILLALNGLSTWAITRVSGERTEAGKEEYLISLLLASWRSNRASICALGNLGLIQFVTSTESSSNSSSIGVSLKCDVIRTFQYRQTRTWGPKCFLLRTFFAVASLCLLSNVHVNAQPATASYRLAETVINDGTSDSIRLNYELGSIMLNHGDSSSRILFVATNQDSTFQTYFRTNNFLTTSAGDSLSFFRYASFIGFDYPKEVDITDQSNPSGYDTAKFMRYDSLMLQLIIAHGLWTSPSTTMFDEISYVFDIIELRRASDDSVIARIDTLHCYRDDRGRLEYTVYPLEQGQVRRVSLADIPTSTPIYLTAVQSCSLPPGASIARCEYNHEIIGSPDGKDINLADPRMKGFDRLDPYDVLKNPDAQINHNFRPYRPRY